MHRVLSTSLVVASLALPSAGHALGDLHEQARSLNQMLDLRIDISREEEISAKEDLVFYLQAAGDKSIISWQQGSVVYVYEIAGEDHPRRALMWFDALTKYGLSAFVASRRGTRNGFQEFRPVRALQLARKTSD